MRRYLAKLPRSTEELIRLHERYVSPFTLILGFLLDVFVISSIDLTRSTFYLLAHLVLAASAIALFHLIHAGFVRGKLAVFIVPFLPSVLQFSFGALFGGLVILYSQSAAYATSWIFVGLLALLLVSNERFRLLYTQLSFQAAIYFAVLMSYCVFFLPVIFLRVGTMMFLASQAVSVVVMLILMRAYATFAHETVRAARFAVLRAMAIILLLFNVLYFTNAIPPIPLALKEAGVYHDIRRGGEGYLLEAEPLEWYQQYLNYNTVFHWPPGSPVYVFASVFAPPGFETEIAHEWERYDEASRRWVEESVVTFPIQGGREGGYRGYSIYSGVTEGRWRVNVTTHGKLIGRIAFTVAPVSSPPATEVIER